MTAPALLTPQIRKEVRALLPTWLGAMCAVLAAPLLRGTDLFGVAALASGFCIVALGAQSFGHEYTHRTLPLLLSQPVSRRRVYLAKIGVLSPMILTAVLFGWMAGVDDFWRRPPHVELSLLFLAATGGLAVAPWLTLLSRGTLPGLVFTMSVPGLLLLGGTVVGALVYGAGHVLEVNAFVSRFLWWAMASVAILSAAAAWVAFSRVEAADGTGEQVAIPSLRARGADASRASAPGMRRRNPWIALVSKELRLQQMTFVVSAIYVCGWIGMAALQRWLSGTVHESPITAVSALYAVVLAMLIGALASAEERQFGTHAANLLLPVSTWKGWMLKAGVSLALTLVLGIVVPSVLLFAGWRVFGWHIGLSAFALAGAVPTVTIAVVCGLYVSSFSGSGVRATVMSFPYMFSAAAWILLVQSFVLRVSYRLLPPSGGRARLAPGQSIFVLQDLMMETAGVLTIGGLILLLWFGYANYRSEGRSVKRISVQAAWLAAYVAFSTALLTLLPPLYFRFG